MASLRLRRIIKMTSNSNTRKLHSTLEQQPTEPLTRSQVKTLVLNNYTNGNFTNLIQNVVASPAVLFTASHNISTTPFHLDRFFNLDSLVQDLRQNRFDVAGCCVSFKSSTQNASPLVLPNLKLKVVIEALRMVLEAVYDERFVTFCYGGRVGMGRHTAISIINAVKTSGGLKERLFNVAYNAKKKALSQDAQLTLIGTSNIWEPVSALMEQLGSTSG